MDKRKSIYIFWSMKVLLLKWSKNVSHTNMSHTTVDFIFIFCLDFPHIYLKIPLKCRKYPIKKVRSFINSYSLHNWKYVVPYVTLTCPIRYGDLSHTFKIIIVNLFDIKIKLCYILITKIYYWNYFHSFQCVVAYST